VVAAALGAPAAVSAGAVVVGLAVVSARAVSAGATAAEPLVALSAAPLAVPSRRSPPQAASSTTVTSVADRVLVIVVLSRVVGLARPVSARWAKIAPSRQ